MSVMDMNSRMAMAEKLSVQQLQQAVQSGSLPAYIGIPLIEQKTKERAQMAAAQQGQQKPPSVAASILQQADEQEQQERGIDELPSNLPMMEDEEMGMANGGIVAFADTGQVVDPYSSYGDVDPLAQFSGITPDTLATDADRVARLKAERAAAEEAQRREFLRTAAPHMLPPVTVVAEKETGEIEDPRLSTGIVGIPNKGTGQRGQVNPNAPATGGTPTRTTQPTPQMTSAAQPESAMDRYARMLEAQGEDSAKSRKDAKAMAIIQAGLGMMGGTSPNAFANIAAGAMPAIQGYQQALQGLRKDDRERIGKLMEMGISKEKLGLELKKLGIEDKKADAMVNLYNARAGAAGSGGGNDIKTANAIRGLDSQLSTNLARVDTQIKNLNSANPMMAAYVNKSPDQIPKGIRDQVTAYRTQLNKLEGEKNKWINLHSSRVQSLGGVTLGDIEGASGGGNMPKGIPPGSKQVGTSGGKPVYESPDGKRYIVE